jgi:hypothetical protein
MHIEQRNWTADTGWTIVRPNPHMPEPHLVLGFGSTAALRRSDVFAQLRNTYPTAHLLACSTAGEIWNTHVLDDSIVATAVHFEHTVVRAAQVTLHSAQDSLEAGRQLAGCLEVEGLVHVLVISDGVQVNGSALVRGLVENLHTHSS